MGFLFLQIPQLEDSLYREETTILAKLDLSALWIFCLLESVVSSKKGFLLFTAPQVTGSFKWSTYLIGILRLSYLSQIVKTRQQNGKQNITEIIVVISADGKFGLLTQLSRVLISTTIQKIQKWLIFFFSNSSTFSHWELLCVPTSFLFVFCFVLLLLAFPCFLVWLQRLNPASEPWKQSRDKTSIAWITEWLQ